MSAPPSCLVCKATDNVSRCSGCSLAYYCGLDHQRSDREGHKKACDAVKRKMEIYLYEKKRFPLQSVDVATVAGLNMTDEWVAFLVPMYVSASMLLIMEVTVHLDHVGATEEVVRLLLECELNAFLLDRPDRRSGEVIPSHYIRLGKDHDAYSHMKWRNFGMPNEPLRVYDMFESPDGMWQSENVNIDQISALALIKVRFLLDLQAIQKAARGLDGSDSESLPREIVDLIRRKLTNSSLLEVRPQLLSASKGEVSALIQMLKGQIRALFVRMVNHEHYSVSFHGGSWFALTKEQACFMVRSLHLAWVESPGAVDVAAAVAASFKDEIEVPVRNQNSTGAEAEPWGWWNRRRS